MVLEHTQTVVGYFCPACGTSVLSIVGIFALSGDMIRLKCPCGQSELTLSYTSDRKIHLSVPCLVCPRPHLRVISQDTFFENSLFTVPCTLSGFDMCFIGTKDDVCAAMRHTEQQILQTLEQAGVTGCKNLHDVVNCTAPVGGDAKEAQPKGEEFEHDLNFPDNHIFDLVNFVVRDLADEGKIFCGCAPGRGDYELVPAADHVTVRCRNCGKSREIPCNNSLFANAFLEYDSLTLK